jgi:hypothetical protein
MAARPLARLRFASRLASALLIFAATRAAGQVIQIKTLPIADGDQWRIFPSAASALGDVSIALADSLLDPFTNPAKGSRVASGRGAFFSSPTFYSLSDHAGGGRTLPIGGLARWGSSFGGFMFALQEIDSASGASQVFFPPGPVALSAQTAPGVAPVVTTTTVQRPNPSRQNQFAFGSLGHLFERSRISVAGSVLWSGLHDIDGTESMYAGSAGVVQHGNSFDARIGVTKDWSAGADRGDRTAELVLLRNSYAMTHDVTWIDQVWDPNQRTFTNAARIDNNLDQTNTWGLHVGYSQPVSDSGLRVGAIATMNLASHPKLPDYQIAQVAVIPWDPGHSAAYDLGVGVARVQGPLTFGLDAIYEPILSHTWGEAHGATPTASGSTIPDGGKTTENRFHFSNGILRAGVGHDFETGAHQILRVQLGIGVRSIDYTLDQTDHVAETTLRQSEHWNEWTRTWGLSLHFTDLELRYAGRSVTGTGRPGIAPNGGVFFAADAAGPNILAAPNGPLSLTNVSVMTHQFSVSLPIR